MKNILIFILAAAPFLLQAQIKLVTKAATLEIDTSTVHGGSMFDVIADTNWCDYNCVVTAVGFTFNGVDSVLLDAGGVGSVLHLWIDTSSTDFHYRLEIQDAILSEVSTYSNAKKGAWLPVNSTGGAKTIVPPSNPQTGDWFGVIDSRAQALVNNITIYFSGSSQKINGSVTNSAINSNGAVVKFIYINSTVGWVRQ